MALHYVFRWLKIIGFILMALSAAKLAWSGIRPSAGDPKAWYDRVIRSVGGMIVSAFFAFLAFLGFVSR